MTSRALEEQRTQRASGKPDLLACRHRTSAGLHVDVDLADDRQMIGNTSTRLGIEGDWIAC